MANTKDDFNDTWLAKIPAPQFNYPNNVREVLDADQGTIYLHALYWSYVTSSHIGVGDVVGINSGEKYYSSFVIYVSVIMYAFLFGSLASIVEDFTPEFQRVFEKNYRYVLEYAKTSKLENFVERIHKYYNYIWLKERGVNEDQLLNALPKSIKYDIFLFRYNNTLRSSQFFKNSQNQFDQTIYYSFCKNYRTEIYLENDSIITSGQKRNDVYFILDGEVEVIQNESWLMETQKLRPGDYFGGIIQNQTQYQDLKAIKITRVAKIEQSKFIQLMEAYPEWYTRLAKREKIDNLLRIFINKLKGAVYAKKLEKLNNNKNKLKNKFQNFKLNLSRKVDDLISSKSKSQTSSPQKIGSILLNLSSTKKPQTKINDQDMKEEGSERMTKEVSESPRASVSISPPQKSPENDQIFKSKPSDVRSKTPPKSRFHKAESGKRGSIEEDKENLAPKRTHSLNIKTAYHNNDESKQNYSAFVTNKDQNVIMMKEVSSEVQNAVPDFSLQKKQEDDFSELGFFIHPESDLRYFYEFIHTIVILYSSFGVPVYVCFDLKPDATFIILEVLTLIEQVLYLFFQTRTAQYFHERLTLDWQIILRSLLEKDLILELFTLIPLNLALGVAQAKTPFWLVGILRMNRVFLIKKLPYEFALFGTKWLKLTSHLKVIKPAFYLAFVWHFTSCLWNWFLLFDIENQYEQNWYNVLALNEAAVWQRYILCLSFTMNIATTTGYPELIIYNNYERAVWILYVYFGDALFGLTFAWFAVNASTLPDKFNFVFDRIRQMDYVLQKNQIPPKLRNKLEDHFAYIVETRDQNKSCLDALSGLLPISTLKDMEFVQARCLNSIPLVKEFKHNKMFLNEIVMNLKPAIYLPEDYITSRNENGNEMFIIAQGTVHMLSPNEKKVLCILEQDSYFGELSLFANTKRLTSFVAASFCLIYILDRPTLNNILKAFPQLDSTFKRFAKYRVDQCVVEGRNRRDQLQQAYATLCSKDSKRNKIVTHKEEIIELLKASEIAQVHLQEDKFMPGSRDIMRPRVKSRLLTAMSKKEAEEGEKEELESMSEISSIIEEYVDDEEIEHKDIDTKKSSFRRKTQTRERRYSRLNMGKEMSVSRSSGLTLRWGINMD